MVLSSSSSMSFKFGTWIFLIGVVLLIFSSVFFKLRTDFSTAFFGDLSAALFRGWIGHGAAGVPRRTGTDRRGDFDRRLVPLLPKRDAVLDANDKHCLVLVTIPAGAGSVGADFRPDRC